MFEFLIWNNVCVKKLGWPILNLDQLRCTKSRAAAHALPLSLDKCSEVLCSPDKQKLKDGKRLIHKFSIPRNPTKKDDRKRILPIDAPVDGPKFHVYCVGDVKAEDEVSHLIPHLSQHELEVWKLDQRINARGVYVDREALENCISVVDCAFAQYTKELDQLTGGFVSTVSEVAKFKQWLSIEGLPVESINASNVKKLLSQSDVPANVRRALEIRQILGSSSVKKLHTIHRSLCDDGRMRDLFVYCGATRTGRTAGKGAQPHNLPRKGPEVVACGHCGKHRKPGVKCPWCGYSAENYHAEWNSETAEDALIGMQKRNLRIIEHVYGDPVTAVSGCLRGLFCAAPGHDLICSDFSAIEAVVLAELAEETWRQRVFRSHGKIYEMSASKITGIPFEEYLNHKARTGEHHPTRDVFGKKAELAWGYGGGVNAGKVFGMDKHIKSDEEIMRYVRKWREESPNIVNFWHALENAAKSAVKAKDRTWWANGISFKWDNGVLYCMLPSGRRLAYHSPNIEPRVTSYGREVESLTFMTYNTNAMKGPVGWIKTDTFGGRLTENVVQATARDILMFAMLNLEKAGYPIVLHVHDEIVAEIKKDFGSIQEFEKIMSTLPSWANGWPIKAAGGWRGHRFRKD
jgi:DNA polymerase